jgi:hypothetical protein
LWYPTARGGLGAVFVLLIERKKRDAENTAKPRRNCSGEALLLTT